MYCKNCGKQIADDSKFCSFCGAEITNNNYQVNQEPSIMNARFNYVNNNHVDINKKSNKSPLYILSYIFNIFIILTVILVFMAAPFISIFFNDKDSSAKVIIVSIGLSLMIIDALLNGCIAVLLIIKNKKFFTNFMTFRVVIEAFYIVTIALYIVVLSTKTNSIINILGPVSGLITSSMSFGLMGINRSILAFNKYINK